MNNPRLNKQQKQKILEWLFCMMISGEKVKVIDKYDNKERESRISSVYSDYTVILCDCVHSDYKVSEIITENTSFEKFVSRPELNDILSRTNETMARTIELNTEIITFLKQRK